MDTTATVDPSRSTLDAGQEGRVVLTVRNDSEIVEDYSFRVVGDLAEWSSVEPTHVSVFPGQSATAVIAFTPPRSSVVMAGEHPYGVHVRPAKRPENATVPEGSVEVLPFFDTVAELSPQSTRSKKGGQYRVTVDNRGNAPVAVALAGKSASDGMDLALSESDQTMEPGTTWSSELRTEPVKRLWRGAPTAFPFTVMVRPEEGPEVALAGTQYQDPVLPAWFFKALTGLLAMVVALAAWTAAAGGFPPWNQGDDDPVTEPTAAPTDGSAGGPASGPAEESSEPPASDPAEESPEPPASDPAEESPEAPAGSDTLTLPLGMVGQQAEPLIERIQLMGVNVDPYEVPTADYEPGTVLRTEPADGSAVTPGDTVKIWVAIEPADDGESFPVRLPLSTPPVETDVRPWPQEPSENTYIITGLFLENPQGDVGTFTVELDDETLYEGRFDSVSDGENLIRDEDEGEDDPPVPDGGDVLDDLQARNETDALPLDPITVEAGQQLWLTTTCQEVGSMQTPELTACNETFELDGRDVDAAASG